MGLDFFAQKRTKPRWCHAITVAGLTSPANRPCPCARLVDSPLLAIRRRGGSGQPVRHTRRPVLRDRIVPARSR